MKKIIGFLAIAVMAMTLFFNTNAESINNTDLASLLIATNVANAEGGGTATVPCVDSPSSGSIYNKRKCVGCTWDSFNVNDNGKCTISY